MNRILAASFMGGVGMLAFFYFCTPTVRAVEEIYSTEPEVIVVDGEAIKVLSVEYEAQESPCQRIFECNVPAPTVIAPASQSIFRQSGAVLITGLSWNQTKVDVYIDGVYNGRATLRTDPSEVGDFFYRPFLPLTPGRHTLYTVARNLSETERSPQSPTIVFTVQALSSPKPEGSTAGKAAEQKKSSEASATPISVSPSSTVATTTDASSANSFLDWFFNEQTSTATNTASSVRTPLRIIVSIVALIIIGYWTFRSHRTDADSTAPPDQHVPPAE